MIVGVALIDIFVGQNVVLIGLLILGPLLASTRSTPRDVVAVCAIAIAVGIPLGVADDSFGTTDHMLRLLIVLAGCLMAVWTASIRQARERTSDLLGAQASVARILASSRNLSEVTPRVLETVGRLLDWHVGIIWRVVPRAGKLACVQTWCGDGVDVSRFLTGSTQLTFRRGEGLPGRVWESGRPQWVSDVLADDNFPRAEEAAASGLHAAFCFPIRGLNGIIGVIEFLAAEPRHPDGHLLDLMDSLGGQLGDYIERTLAEEAVRVSDARKTAVVRAAVDCIITMDHEGRVVEFNPAAEKTFGYSSEEAVGRELAELIIPPDLRERHREGLSRYLAGGEEQVLGRRVEMRGMRKDGSEFPIEMNITTIAIEPPMFTGYLRDISEQRSIAELRERLASIVESSEDAILSKDRRAIITSWNLGAQKLYGYTPEEAIGMPIQRLVPERRHGEEITILNQILGGVRVEHYETERVRKDGSEVSVSLMISPLRDATGEILGASVIARDITEQKLLEAQQARASFLTETHALLGSSLDYGEILNNLARLVVPNLADWCAIDMLRPDGELERLACAHVDPDKERLALELEQRFPLHSTPDRGQLRAVRNRQAELIPELTPEVVDPVAQSDEHKRLLESLGLRSVMVVPLVARDRALGVIVFGATAANRAFDDEDLSFAQELADRAAIAVDNARLYGERNYVASTLQQALMPDNLPDVPGVELAARYLAAGEGNEVGGDFYDIYRAGESTWAVAIGDVRGKGPRAAAVTALARYTLRTASLSDTVPSRILTTLNEAMLRQPSDDRFCTVAYASIEATDSGVNMTLGVGGHPLPLLLRNDGTVERAGRPGTV
ncbi:MAG TPA: PAS domain S-box protein, partial [Candidatus Dormibacteraeota bacterium]|nr:PAS domain S-box protein [Candidatus Dormibacteraeota bacterium]